MKGKDLPTLEWPPLIHGAYVSGRVQVRDFVLTVLAWALLVYMVRGTLHLAYDNLRPPIFSFSSLSPPDWRELWGRLLPFWYFIAPLMLWLLFWALWRGRAMKTTEPVSQPPALALEVHAAGFGLETETLSHWPEQRILVVHFDADGNISHADVRAAPSPHRPAGLTPAPAAAQIPGCPQHALRHEGWTRHGRNERSGTVRSFNHTSRRDTWARKRSASASTSLPTIRSSH